VFEVPFLCVSCRSDGVLLSNPSDPSYSFFRGVGELYLLMDAPKINHYEQLAFAGVRGYIACGSPYAKHRQNFSRSFDTFFRRYDRFLCLL
jgi:hypothetical protein